MRKSTQEPPLTRLSVVMPAYDELPNLRELLPRLLATVADVPNLSTAINVVVPSFTGQDDMEEIRLLGATPVVRGPTNSFGDAIRSGIAAADPEADFVVIMDADGSHDPATIPRLLDAADSAHVVVASRYIPGGASDNSFLLRTMSHVLNGAYRVALGISCRDVSTNFKLYRRADLTQITLTSTDFDIIEELLVRLKMIHGPSFVIAEVPDRFLERRHGVTKRRLGPFVVSYLKTLVYLSWIGRHRSR